MIGGRGCAYISLTWGHDIVFLTSSGWLNYNVGVIAYSHLTGNDTTSPTTVRDTDGDGDVDTTNLVVPIVQVAGTHDDTSDNDDSASQVEDDDTTTKAVAGTPIQDDDISINITDTTSNITRSDDAKRI